MLIDYQTKTVSERYHLMAQTIIPRPIAWIVTRDEEGIINVAPFSYFMALSSEPPTLIVSIGHKPDGTPKDTLQNIRNTKKCTICLVDEAHLEPMHFSSKPLDHEVSEAEFFDIALEEKLEGFPPIVRDVPAAFFCTLHTEVDLQGSKTIPLVLRIEQEYLDDRCVTTEKGHLKIDFKPVARIGREYALLGKKITPPQIPS